MTETELPAGLPATAPPTVLVVDDEPAVADVLRLLLGEEGYEVRCAYDGAAALAEAERRPPDAVVTDVMLPGLGGADLACRLRERGIPVVVLSAGAAGVAVPGVRCLRKPLDLAAFLEAVALALGR